MTPLQIAQRLFKKMPPFVGEDVIHMIEEAIADARAAGYAEAIEKAALEADAEGKRRIMGPTTDGLAECRKIAKAIRALSPSTKKDMK